MKQVDAAQILNVEMVREIAPQFGCGEEVKSQRRPSQSSTSHWSRLLSCLKWRAFSIESTKIVGVLPTERTVIMKCPEVTRATSAEIFGRLSTKDTVEAKRKVHRGVSLRQFARKFCNIGKWNRNRNGIGTKRQRASQGIPPQGRETTQHSASGNCRRREGARFARRLQIQEKLTAEIAEAIQDILEPQGVIEAEHSCMTLRGVNTLGSTLTTSRLLGVIRDDPRTREESVSLVRGA
jgi:hypothetical protein